MEARIVLVLALAMAAAIAGCVTPATVETASTPELPAGLIVLQNRNATYLVEGETTMIGTETDVGPVLPAGAVDERTFEVNETPVYTLMTVEVAAASSIPDGHLDIVIYDGEGTLVNRCTPDCADERLRATEVKPGSWKVVATSHDQTPTAYAVTLEVIW